jgi:hypothetical protein
MPTKLFDLDNFLKTLSGYSTIKTCTTVEAVGLFDGADDMYKYIYPMQP